MVYETGLYKLFGKEYKIIICPTEPPMRVLSCVILKNYTLADMKNFSQKNVFWK